VDTVNFDLILALIHSDVVTDFTCFLQLVFSRDIWHCVLMKSAVSLITPWKWSWTGLFPCRDLIITLSLFLFCWRWIAYILPSQSNLPGTFQVSKFPRSASPESTSHTHTHHFLPAVR